MAAALSKADARAVKVITSVEEEQARVNALKKFRMFFENVRVTSSMDNYRRQPHRSSSSFSGSDVLRSVLVRF